MRVIETARANARIAAPAVLVVLAATLAATSPRARAGDEPDKAPDGDVAARLAKVRGLVDVATIAPEVQVELKYATADNFLGRNVYGGLRACFLQRDAARMLAAADARLREANPELRLRVYDCARPHSVQVEMWKLVKGTKQQAYVANPHTKTGSIHNYGCAVDLTVAREDGTPLDMGTPFDHFGREAEPRREGDLVLAGKLTHEQVANRLILREAMVRAGFHTIDNEWWHFNCASPGETRKRYPRVP